MPKFGTKNALFRHIWARVLKTIVIFEVSTSNLSNHKILKKKTRMPKFGPKMPWVGIFGLEF